MISFPCNLYTNEMSSQYHCQFAFPLEWHTLPKHWLTQETTAVQYAKHLSLLIIIGNLKGLATQSNISRFLVHSHTCYIRPNTTDRLQPMHTAVTKLSKEHIQSSLRHGTFIQCGKAFSQKATLPGTHSTYNINTHSKSVSSKFVILFIGQCLLSAGGILSLKLCRHGLGLNLGIP